MAYRALRAEAHQAALELRRGTRGDNLMYFETGQGSALSANALSPIRLRQPSSASSFARRCAED